MGKKAKMFTLIFFLSFLLFISDNVFGRDCPWSDWAPIKEGLEWRVKNDGYNSSARKYLWFYQIRNMNDHEVEVYYSVRYKDTSGGDGGFTLEANGGVQESWGLYPTPENKCDVQFTIRIKKIIHNDGRAEREQAQREAEEKARKEQQVREEERRKQEQEAQNARTQQAQNSRTQAEQNARNERERQQRAAEAERRRKEKEIQRWNEEQRAKQDQAMQDLANAAAPEIAKSANGFYSWLNLGFINFTEPMVMSLGVENCLIFANYFGFEIDIMGLLISDNETTLDGLALIGLDIIIPFTRNYDSWIKIGGGIGMNLRSNTIFSEGHSNLMLNAVLVYKKWSLGAHFMPDQGLFGLSIGYAFMGGKFED
ncbi:MAG: cell envelope integrity protein TolA [Candidatus Aminicenantes bacterium]|nr:cell envelope integrity protein TolA [Candidatus Aminicenantes bacterium]